MDPPDPAVASDSNPPATPGGAREKIVRQHGTRNAIWIALAIVVVLVAAGLGGAYELGLLGNQKSRVAGACPTGVILSGAGANFVLPLVSQWESSYQTEKNNQVSYNPAGAGTGITDLTQITVDFAATDDPLNASQASALGAFLTLPITGGGLAIVYNLPGVNLSLSGAVLAQIYLGTITTWNDPAIAANSTGPLPNSPIVTVHRSDAAGTTYVLTDFLSKSSAAWSSGPGKGIAVNFPKNPPMVEAEKGNSALLKYVATTPDTIGYVDLPDTLISGNVQYASILNPAGKFIHPTLANTASAVESVAANATFPSATGDWSTVSLVNAPGSFDYPIVTFAYFFVYQMMEHGYQPSVEKSQVLLQWLHWVVTTGQSAAGPLYYTALPPALVAIDQQGLATLTYNGNAIPDCS
jgi:phosphate transport system substrate-binding protein